MNAFPIVQPPGALIIENGATLRDMFAMATLQGLIASWAGAPGDPLDPEHLANTATRVYATADAMLAARGE